MARPVQSVPVQSADTAERERLTRYEEELAQKLTGKKHLRAIATTPLLCALLCALYRDQHTALPRDRMEVYDAALRMLLKDRDQQRGIAEGVDLSQKELVLLLQELAKWLVVNGSSDAPVSTAQRTVTRSLKSMHRVEDAPEDVFTHLRVRSGLLQSPAVDRVSFLHRTFEEYLAAKALVEEESFPQLAKNAHDDQWHEVVVMAAGHASPAQREELVRALLERSGEVKKHRDRLLLVAFACLETSPQLARALREEVESRVREILPPRTEDHVRALAMVGESVLPLLAEAEPRNANQSRHTIEAAGSIGGPGSVPIIAEAFRKYTTRNHYTLSDAWGMNPSRAFAEQVLPRAHELGHSYIHTDVEHAHLIREFMPRISHLELSGNRNRAPAPGSLPRHVGRLDLTNHGERWNTDDTVALVPEIEHLEYLNLFPETVTTDLSPLLDTAIRSLGLHGSSALENPRTIRNLRNLSYLSLRPQQHFPRLGEILPDNGKTLDLNLPGFLDEDLSFLHESPAELAPLGLINTRSLVDMRGVESQSESLTMVIVATRTGGRGPRLAPPLGPPTPQCTARRPLHR